MKQRMVADNTAKASPRFVPPVTLRFLNIHIPPHLRFLSLVNCGVDFEDIFYLVGCNYQSVKSQWEEQYRRENIHGSSFRMRRYVGYMVSTGRLSNLVSVEFRGVLVEESKSLRLTHNRRLQLTINNLTEAIRAR
jgi:hypothetical protein